MLAFTPCTCPTWTLTLDVYCRARRLEVGSESGPDRSKSIKSYLMQLLGAGGNWDVEVRGAGAASCHAAAWCWWQLGCGGEGCWCGQLPCVCDAWVSGARAFCWQVCRMWDKGCAHACCCHVCAAPALQADRPCVCHWPLHADVQASSKANPNSSQCLGQCQCQDQGQFQGQFQGQCKPGS